MKRWAPILFVALAGCAPAVSAGYTHPTTTTTPATTSTGWTTSTQPSTTTATTTASTTTVSPPPPTFTTTTVAPTTTTHQKVFVCKYEGTPGVDERLQTGQNPISVDYKPGREPGGYFNDAQGRSYVLAYDVGQDEPSADDCPPPDTGTTTTSPTTTSTTGPATTTSTTAATTSSTTSTTTSSTSSTSTTGPTTTSSSSSTSTTFPTGGFFGFSAVGTECVDGEPIIFITFGPRPDLNGQTGELVISDGAVDVYDVTFIAGATIEVFYPDTTDDVTLTYTLGDEVATAEATYPNEGDCAIVETTTTTAPATTVPGATTTSSAPPPAPTTTAAPPSTATTTVRPPSHLPETR